MKFWVIIVFIFLCIKIEICTAQQSDTSLYLPTYNNQSVFDKLLIKKVKNEKTFVATLKSLLTLKADPNAINKKGKTAFSYLFDSLMPATKKIKLFLEYNLNVNQKSVIKRRNSLGHIVKREEAPLEYVSNSSRYFDIIPIIETLLHYKANPNQINSVGSTLLHDIVIRGKFFSYKNADTIPLIKTVLKYNGDVNMKQREYGVTPFHILCAKSSYLSLIPLFLEVSADPNIKSHSDNTPFQNFLENYKKFSYVDIDILKLFIKYNVDLTYFLAKLLKEYVADSYCDISKDSCNNSNTMYESLYLIFFLLRNKADINAIEHYQISQIYSENTFSPEILKSFLSYKLDPTIDIGHTEVTFCYEYAQSFKEKRNMLAYAIPFFIMQHYREKWKTLFLCLNAQKKSCPAYNVPKYLKFSLCGDIAVRINKVLNNIKEIENINWWHHDKKNVFTLKNNIFELINMHNNSMKK